MKLKGNRKGITPVIAIVLLLMVTVGAVGVVYTQFQSLVGDPTGQIDDQQRNQNTDMAIVRAKSNNTTNPQEGVTILEIQNTGSVTRNTSSFRLTTNDASILPGQSGALCTDPSNASAINPSETIDCHTGVMFPSATTSITFTWDLTGTEKDWSYECRPRTTNTAFC